MNQTLTLILFLCVGVIIAMGFWAYFNSPPSVGPAEELSAVEKACIESGGAIANSLCCKSASDFPNSCLIGACGCSPENSHWVKICDCREEKCFDGERCTNFPSAEEEAAAPEEGAEEEPELSDSETKTFNKYGELKVFSPDGGEEWKAGEVDNIEWGNFPPLGYGYFTQDSWVVIVLRPENYVIAEGDLTNDILNSLELLSLKKETDARGIEHIIFGEEEGAAVVMHLSEKYPELQIIRMGRISDFGGEYIYVNPRSDSPELIELREKYGNGATRYILPWDMPDGYYKPGDYKIGVMMIDPARFAWNYDESDGAFMLQ